MITSLGSSNTEILHQRAENTSHDSSISATKEEFLLLLVTQLQHQDPLNPMEAREFTAQLAQFSLLEQALQTNEYLKTLSLYEASANNARAVNLIGKEIMAAGDQVSLSQDGTGRIYFNLSKDSARTQVFIYDPSGRLIRVIEGGGLQAGDHIVSWDGKDQAGNVMPPGAYTFQVKAKDPKGTDIEVKQFIRGKATGASFKDRATSLIVEGVPVVLGSILEVRG